MPFRQAQGRELAEGQRTPKALRAGWPAALIAVACAALSFGCADIVRADPRMPPPPPAHGRGPYGHGSGIILVDVEPKSGKVTGARMLASTGYAEFDSAAIMAFRHRRFKPGSAGQLRIPVSFRVKGKRL
jgi:TonB family protein